MQTMMLDAHRRLSLLRGDDGWVVMIQDECCDEPAEHCATYMSRREARKAYRALRDGESRRREVEHQSARLRAGAYEAERRAEEAYDLRAAGVLTA